MYRSILSVTSPSYYSSTSTTVPLSDLSELENHTNSGKKCKTKTKKNNIPTLTPYLIEHINNLADYWKQWGFMDKRDAAMNICSRLCKELKEVDYNEKINDLDSFNDEEISNDN